MTVFVYEYLTALGVGRDPGAAEHAMFREGRAMRDALAADLAALAATEVVALDEVPADRERIAFAAHAATADWSVVIAPEFDGLLAERAAWVGAAGGRLLGCTVDALALTSDKLALFRQWRERGVPTPATTDRELTPCEAFPVVWKPRDGAGSTATFRLDSALDVARAKATRAAEGHAGPMIVQEFVAGTPASVSFLCGPAGHVPLAPAFQHLTDDGRFTYRGGELPLPPPLTERAVALGTRALTGIPGLFGYLGVDLILGEVADVAVEINPRLTTSYVGLRALAGFNVAAAMVRVATGEAVGPMPWRPGPVRFAADG